MTEMRLRFAPRAGEKVEMQTIIAEPSEAIAHSGTDGAKEVKPDDQGLEKLNQCAGEWTHAIASLANPPYQMNIVNATSWQQMLPKARVCRGDVTGTTWFSSPVIICAPYIRCTA